MACLARGGFFGSGYLRPSDSLPSNDLGFRQFGPPKGAPRRAGAVAAAPPVAACCGCCIADGAVRVPAYEANTLTGYVANNVISASTAVENIRVVASATLRGQTFATGAAVSSSLWAPGGFVTTPDGAAVALRSASSLGVTILTVPYAMCAVPDRGVLVIVGAGELQPSDGGPSDGLKPSVALVTLSVEDGCVADVSVYVGAGPTQLNAEVYTSVSVPSDLTGPCCPTLTVDVCGSFVNDEGATVATYRRLQIDKLFAPAYLAGGATYQTFGGAGEFVHSTGTCVASSVALGLVLVGVLNYDVAGAPRRLMQSTVWALQLDGTPVLFSGDTQMTGFNGPANVLPVPTSETGGIVILRILIAPGRIFVLAAAGAQTTAVYIPPTTTVLYAFQTDTNPATDFGTLGIVQWSPPGYGSAVPQDIVLDAAGTALYMAGDTFAAESELSSQIVTYAFAAWWRGVTVPQVGGMPLTTPPYPFVARVLARDGSVAAVLTGLPGCPASQMQFAATLVVTSVGTVQVLGDWASNPLGVAQPAGILNVVLRNGVVQNCAAVADPVIEVACNGVVSIDTRCIALPTTLVVNGPIVAGFAEIDSTTYLPGAIRFNPSTQRFEGYTGSSWVSFVMGT